MKSKLHIFFLTSVTLTVLASTSGFAATWTGATDDSWASAGNWTGTAPDNVTAQAVVFDSSSTANLTQTLNGSYILTGISVTSPSAAVIINNGTGTNALTTDSGGIDLSAASQNLTLNGFNVAIGANQSWNVGSGRIFNVGSSGGTITLTNKLTKTGLGTFNLGGSGATTLTGAGALEINGGTFQNNMQAGSSAAERTGATTLTSGNLVISTSISMFGSGALNLNGGAIGSGTGTGRSFTNGVNIGGDIAVGGAGFSSGLITFSGDANLQGNTRKISSNLSGGLGAQFSGVVSNGAIEVTGSSNGILTLSGTNTYTGATTVTSGYLAIGNSAVSNSSSLSLAASTRLYVGVNGTTTVNNLSGAGTATIRTDFTITGGSGSRELEVNQTTDGTYAGSFTEGGSRQISLVKKGNAVLTLTGSGGYSGATTVSEGTLLINNTSGTGSVSAASGATLGGTGTIGGATTISGTHAAGDAGFGTQTFSSTLTYSANSIFEWDLSAPTADPGSAPNAGDYDKVVATGAVSGGDALFKVVLGTNNFNNAFWNTDKSWTNIFTGTGAPSLLGNVFSGFDVSGGLAADGTVVDRGQFTFNGSTATLNWTAVPEPSSALAGLLIAAGLLRRRRSA